MNVPSRRSWLTCLLLGGWVMLGGPATSPGCQPRPQESVPPVDESVAPKSGLYLVHRWTNQRSELFPLLDGEILLHHDPRQIDEQSTEPVVFLTVKRTDRVLFENHRDLEAIPQDDGRIQLQMTLSPDSADELEQLSRRTLGRQVATVVGNRVITIHKVRSVIRGGKIQISRCTDEGCEVLMRQLTRDP